MTEHRAGEATWEQVDVDPNGPIVVPGPVQVRVAGAEPVLVRRFRVALCACGRSGRYPLCDSSHRRLRG
jgi:CDGSH-type Zn-finger protein